MKGNFKIVDSKLNGIDINERDIRDEKSQTYIFLKKTITEKVFFFILTAFMWLWFI